MTGGKDIVHPLDRCASTPLLCVRANVRSVRRSESSTDMMAENRSHRRPQHQLPQQERTVQQRQPLVAVAGLVVGLLAGVGVERLLQAAFPAWTTAFTRWRM